MQPTYSIQELHEIVPTLDNKEIKVLQELISEELKRYSYNDAVEAYELMMSRIRQLQSIALENGGGISDIFFIRPEDL